MKTSPAQTKAIASLIRAFNECHEAGLRGAVVDGRFAVWSSDFAWDLEELVGLEGCDLNDVKEAIQDKGQFLYSRFGVEG